MKLLLALSLLSLVVSNNAAPPLSVRSPEASPTKDQLGFSAIEARQTGDTENDIVDGSPCKALTVIFARGTTETGNVGTITGPPFFQALYNDIGAPKVALQGVDYPADIQGFLAGGDDTGSRKMADLVGQTAGRCPGSKIVLSGYR
ncbi:MAG: hypothetical protein Q9170_004862 [Blastenia crenularia]